MTSIEGEFPAPSPCNVLTTFADSEGTEWESPSPPLAQSASLQDRLHAWRNSPVANQSVWLDFNSQTCTISGPEHRTSEREVSLGPPPQLLIALHPALGSQGGRVAPVHSRLRLTTFSLLCLPSIRTFDASPHDSAQVWKGIDSERILELREQLISSLELADAAGNLTIPDSQKGTRGIVYTAGNADTFSRVVTSLRLLRHFGSTLPAEVFHFADADENVSDGDLAELTRLGATIRTVADLDKQRDAGRSKSFHIKGAALVQSSFDEVLMLDSDSLPAADVEPLFDAPGFIQSGAMYWPDFWREDGANAVWAIMGVQCRDEWTQEAGQLLIRKSEHMDAYVQPGQSVLSC